MPLPVGYVAALGRLSLAFRDYRSKTGNEAVLVGGAATAILTDGEFPSGDFDIVAGADDAFREAMTENGFRREAGGRYLLKGFFHPEHPEYGFEQVSRPLFDGRADRNRLTRIPMDEAGSIEIYLPSVEDMIADRLGQYAVSSPDDDSRLRQARAMFDLADKIDEDYLVRRIRDEGGDPGLLDMASRRHT